MANDLEQDNNQANYIADLIKAAEHKAKRKTLRHVQGSLLVPVESNVSERTERSNLGITPTPNTLVRLDFNADREKNGSKIPLQDEFSFHLMLAARVYGQIAIDLSPSKDPDVLNQKALLKKTEKAHQEAMKRVNRYIKRAYRDASKVAKEGDGLNLAKFNASLDKARKKIAPMAHTILMEKLIETTGIIFTEENLKKAKHTAETTPATTEDILYVDKAAGLVTLIKGSEYTAHHRVDKPKEFAHRQIITCRRGDDGEVTPGLNPRIQIRTPSPVVKKGLKEKAIISDVAAKLSEINEVYNLQEKLSDKKPKAFIYNRYTAINDMLGDINGNLQTQSAAHILQGAHEYNAKNINDGVVCFVQNISVNGFGDTLSYKSRSSLVRESTLMAEMALMHTLCSPEELSVLNGVVKNYKDYLDTPNRARYFSETRHGNAARVHMLVIKDVWKTDEAKRQQTPLDPVAAVKMSLKKLVAHDLHLTHEHAKLVQTLSVFSEEASIGGCKSGNERAQAINGRVLMLDGMKEYSPITKKLMALAHASKDEVLSKAEALNTCLNEEYNKEGLYAAASVISLVDQGASAKVEAKQHNYHISRNFAEEYAEVMTNLKQSKAGAMQAHKGLTKFMRGAWSDHAMSDWSYMSSSSLGVLGAVAAVMTVIPAVLACLKNKQIKARKIEARRKHNERIHELEVLPSTENKSRIKKWLEKIGNYEVKKDPALHLSGQEKKALYRATHQGTTPKGAREDFIRFLGLRFLDKHGVNRDVPMSDKTITLKELLGEEGCRLYHKAIVEEGKSKSFRRAVFEKSRAHVEGPTWSKRLILWVGGPSSSGKTYSAMNVLKFLEKEKPGLLGANKESEPDNELGNDVVFADGSFEREVSQMRQMVLQCALASGYKGILDLHERSQALSVKKYVKDTVLASKRFSMVIPDTFVRLGLKKERSCYESLSRKSNFVHLFSEIKAEKIKDNDEDKQKKLNQKYAKRFQTSVKHMGESRAWRTEPFAALDIEMNNLDIDCESKVYEPKHFWKGRDATRHFKRKYKEESQDKITLKITNDLMYLQQDGGSWRECNFNDNLLAKENGKAKTSVFMPARAYEAWLKVKHNSPDLLGWYKNNGNREDFKQSIKLKTNEKHRSKKSFSSENEESRENIPSVAKFGFYASNKPRGPEGGVKKEFGQEHDNITPVPPSGKRR